MKVSITLDIEDYVYEFYQKGSARLGHTTVKAMMEEAIFQYAGIVASALLKNEKE